MPLIVVHGDHARQMRVKFTLLLNREFSEPQMTQILAEREDFAES